MASAFFNSPSVQAAEPQFYLKLTCIPELDYMEIISIYSEFTLDEEVRQKYFLWPKDIECMVRGKKVTITMSKMQFEYVAGEEYKYLMSLIADQGNYSITINRDGLPWTKIDNFGTWSYQVDAQTIDEFPHMIVYDRYNLKVCTGVGTRECKVISPPM